VKNIIAPYLFSRTGLSDLHGFVDRHNLFAFDLDGTLAPIVDHAGKISISEAVREVLAGLCSRAPVAIITGRSRTDAAGHLGIVPRFLVGNHGAEGLPGWEEQEKTYIDTCRAWEDQLSGSPVLRDIPGVMIENKGATLSIHYRAACNQERVRLLIGRVVKALLPPPRLVAGKCVENLLPREAPDKGTAMQRLMDLAGCAKGLYAGDDVTDEEVFRIKGGHLFTVKVGTEVPTQAMYYLKTQGEVVRLLKEINDRLTSVGGSHRPGGTM
jgi:trehalose 6-phosphate phosphatase